jgi:hypothetical protein
VTLTGTNTLTATSGVGKVTLVTPTLTISLAGALPLFAIQTLTFTSVPEPARARNGAPDRCCHHDPRRARSQAPAPLEDRLRFRGCGSTSASRSWGPGNPRLQVPR